MNVGGVPQKDAVLAVSDRAPVLDPGHVEAAGDDVDGALLRVRRERAAPEGGTPAGGRGVVPCGREAGVAGALHPGHDALHVVERECAQAFWARGRGVAPESIHAALWDVERRLHRVPPHVLRTRRLRQLAAVGVVVAEEGGVQMAQVELDRVSGRPPGSAVTLTRIRLESIDRLDEMAAISLQKNNSPKPMSGRQEGLENIVTQFLK